VIKWLD